MERSRCCYVPSLEGEKQNTHILVWYVHNLYTGTRRRTAACSKQHVVSVSVQEDTFLWSYGSTVGVVTRQTVSRERERERRALLIFLLLLYHMLRSFGRILDIITHRGGQRRSTKPTRLFPHEQRKHIFLLKVLNLRSISQVSRVLRGERGGGVDKSNTARDS